MVRLRHLAGCLALVVAASLSVSGVAVHAQKPRLFTVDDVFRLEEIGDTAVSPDGAWLAYVIKRPRATALHHKRDYLSGNDRGDVWVVPTVGGEPKNVTRGAADGSGYWAPSWSPDGQQLAMASTKGDSVRVWIWNRQSNGLTRVTDRAIDMPFNGVVVYSWISPGSLVVPVLPPGEQPPGMTVETRAPETAMRAWPKAWKGEATVNALDAGTPGAFDSRTQGQLLLVDTRTGTQKPVMSGRFRQLQVSPDGHYVSFLRKTDVIRPTAGEMLFTHLGNDERYQISVATADGTVVASSIPAVREVLSGSSRWSADGASLAFLGYPTKEAALRAYRYRPATRSLESLDTAGLQLTGPTEAGGLRSVLRWSATGELVVFSKSAEPPTDEPSPNRWDWWLLQDGRAPTALTSGMKAVPSSVVAIRNRGGFVGIAGGEIVQIATNGESPRGLTERFEPAVSSIVWPTQAASAGTNTLVVRTRRDGRTSLYSVDLLSGDLRPLASPVADAVFREYSDRSDISVFSLSSRTGSYLWTTGRDSRDPRTIVHLNSFLEGIAEGALRKIAYPSLDGVNLSAWLILPAEYREGTRYPLVTSVYAGYSAGDVPPPNARNDNSSTLNLQLLAAHGYAVLIPSMPLAREGVASDPYFELMKGVMPAVDKAIEIGVADPERLGVMGHSYGGDSTYGLVTQTRRFKAAIAMAGTSDLISRYGEFDPRSRYEEYSQELMAAPSMSESGQLRMAVPPWLDPSRYIRNSPLFYADRVETPLMIVQGDMDYVPITQGEEFFTALYRQNKRAAFVRYWGEGHIIQGPANTRDLWQRVYGWFDEFFGVTRNVDR